MRRTISVQERHVAGFSNLSRLPKKIRRDYNTTSLYVPSFVKIRTIIWNE